MQRAKTQTTKSWRGGWAEFCATCVGAATPGKGKALGGQTVEDTMAWTIWRSWQGFDLGGSVDRACAIVAKIACESGRRRAPGWKSWPPAAAANLSRKAPRASVLLMSSETRLALKSSRFENTLS